jgi:hypothetical protein
MDGEIITREIIDVASNLASSAGRPEDTGMSAVNCYYDKETAASILPSIVG